MNSSAIKGDDFPMKKTMIPGLGPLYISKVYPLVIEHSYGKSPCFMGKFTISIAFFHSYVSHYQRLNPITTHENTQFSYSFPMVLMKYLVKSC